MERSEIIEQLCMGCMHEKNTESKCLFCGFDESGFMESPHHLPLRTILGGKYFVGRVLGEGGFGITYLGWDLNLDIKIAIKEYYPAGFVTRENTTTNTVMPYVGEKEQFFIKGRGRFVDEAKSLAKFYALPGIVSVKDFFLENGTAYIVMEFVEGETLKQLISHTGGKMPAGQVFEMMKPLMRSLSDIHRAGIIHRDISPDNIMVTKEGNVKLLDFGAARNFEESENKSMSVLLKPGYAPEEQYRSHGIQGPWTDIYALCSTIYRAITGITPSESIERVQNDNVKKPSQIGIAITPQQEAVLMKGMSVLKNERYQSMEELDEALLINSKNLFNQPTSRMSIEKKHNIQNNKLNTTSVSNIEKYPENKKSIPKIILFTIAASVALIAIIIISINFGKQTGEQVSFASSPVSSAKEISGTKPVITSQTQWNHPVTTNSSQTAPTADMTSSAENVAVQQPGNLAKLNRWSICCGNEHVVVQLSDGTLLALGSDKDNQCEVSDWHNILQLQGGYAQTIGLCSDGTVVGTVMPSGDSNQYGQCDVSSWTNIIQIESGWVHTVGLKNDGTVVATGYNKYKQCNTDSWRNIAEVAAGGWNTAALTKDGHVYSIGDNAYGQLNTPWEGITQIAVGRQFVAGLKTDGTVVASGRNKENQCSISNFKNIVEIAAGDYHIVGLRQDGTVVATPLPADDKNNYGQCNVTGWKGIIAIYAGARCTIGMKQDGSLLYTGIHADTYQQLSDIKCIIFNS